MAAGKGKRMKTGVPKVLHPICGKPILGYVLDAVRSLGAGNTLVVVGHGSDLVREALGDDLDYVEQEEQRGTGHAVMVAMEELSSDYREVLVLPGDSPLVRADTLEELVDARRRSGAAASLLSVELENPEGYGRVIRGSGGEVKRIVEESDAGELERGVSEVNACTYALDRERLQESLAGLDTDNAQGEYYITGVVELMVAGGEVVVAVSAPAEEVLGINDREQLAEAQAIMRSRINQDLMAKGVSMLDPGQTYIDYGVEVGGDTVIMPLVFLQGATEIGEGCVIGPCTSIKDCRVGDRVRVEFSWMEGVEVEPEVQIGPYSKVRPGTRIGRGARIGSFVEIKNTVVGAGSKVPHLSYMGDAEIGEGVNIGAGSITCNYDGERKSRTEIGDRAFIGSDTMLIAPVRIGEDSVTGAGSSIYEDVPDGNLGIERSKQRNVPDWHKRRQKRNRRESEGWKKKSTGE